MRLINNIEKSIINESLLEISSAILPFLEKFSYKFYIILNKLEEENIYPMIYLISDYQSDILNNMILIDNIISAGLYFGFLKKGRLLLSLEGTEFLHEHEMIPKSKQMIVNKKGEKSILYGNNILKKMVRTMPLELEKNDFLVVFNQNQEIIAITKSLIDYKSYQDLDSNKITALNLVDKGYYLRRKQ
ncbi:MAG: hypothetical protein ACTSR7_06990 [Promethearchaeota archaeon]